MKFSKKYFAACCVFLLIELLIALYVKDRFVRPFVGDVLVIILMYTFVRSFIVKPNKYIPLYLFFFAVVVELAQYFKIVEVLNLQNNRFISVILGTTFDIKDIVCYFIGMILLIVWQKLNKQTLKP